MPDFPDVTELAILFFVAAMRVERLALIGFHPIGRLRRPVGRPAP